MLGKKSEHELSNVYAIIKPLVKERQQQAKKEKVKLFGTQNE